MAANFFDPTASLLADSQARLAAVTAPPAIAPAQPAPAPAPPAVDLVRSFEAAANQFGVPVDALLAMAEKDSGFDHLSRSRGPGAKSRGMIRMSDEDMARERVNPYDAPQAIGVAAKKLRALMDRGATLDDALRAHGGGGDAGEAYRLDITQRAKRLADKLYPEEAPVDPTAHNMDIPKPAAAAAPGVLGTMNDMRVAVDQGLNIMVQDIDGVARKVLPDRVMNAIDAANRWMTGGKTGAEAAKANEERLQKEYSPKMRESLAKKWWNQDKGEFGDAFSDGRAYAGAVLQSLPESVATSGPALKLAKGAYALNIARGATPAAAAARAATVATVAGAVTEGALGGAQSEREVREEILDEKKLPIETLRKSEAFQTMVAQGMSEDAARRAPAHDIGVRAFVTGGIATGIFGGMGDRIIAKSFLGRAAGSGWKDTMKRLGGAALGEGLAEELPQSVLQQVAQNEAVRHADPNKSLMDDVINQGLGGAVAGGIMGAGMGGAFHHATRDTEQSSAPAQAAAPATPATPTPPAAPQVAAPAAPSGPLGRALDAGAPHLTEVAKPSGGEVVVTDEVGQMTGHVIAQDKDGVTFQSADGQRFLYSPAEIASGAVKVEAAPAETISAPPAPLSAEPVAAPMTPAEAPRAALAPPTGEDRALVAPLATTDAAPPPVARGEAGADQRPVTAVANAQSEDPKTGFWVKRLEGGDPKNISYALMRGDDHVDMAALTLDKFDDQGRPVSGYIESIGGRDYSAPTGEGWQSGVNSLGPRAILALRRQFQADFPTVSTLNADRASGARFGGDYERTVADQKPMQVNMRAEDAGKDATTDTAPVARADDTASRATGTSKIEVASAPRNEAARQIDPDLSQASEPALRVKLKTLATQARNAGGWTAEMKVARREIEAEIGKRQRAAEAPASAAQRPLSPPRDHDEGHSPVAQGDGAHDRRQGVRRASAQGA